MNPSLEKLCDWELLMQDIFVMLASIWWMKLYKPLAYFCCGTMCGYLPKAFHDVCQPTENCTGTLAHIELISIGENDTYQKTKKSRFERSTRWLHDSQTPMLQSIGVTLMSPLMKRMGAFF